MFFLCIFILECFGFARSFPVQNCNSYPKTIIAVQDCRGEIEEQQTFTQAFCDTMDRSQRMGKVYCIFTMMIGKKCLKNVHNFKYERTFQYNETISKSSVLSFFKESWKGAGIPCGSLCVSFVFLFSVSDINNTSNPIIQDILDNTNENIAYNIFFIIQSSENPANFYSAVNFIHFTPSFKNLNVTEIFDKICDKNAENDFLVYSGRSSVKSDYRIFNQLSNISVNDAICLCADRCGMRLLTLELYDEVVDLVQYINNLSIANGTSGINMILRINTEKNDGRLISYWENKNPFIFSKPSLIEGEMCFYLNLSRYANSILFHNKNVYNLGSYLVEIDCYEPWKHSLIVCEGEPNIQLYNIQQNKQRDTVTDIVALTYIHIINIFRIFYGKDINVELLECDSENQFRNESYKPIRICINHINKTIDNSTNNRNNTVTLLYKTSNTIFYLKEIDISNCKMYSECQKMPYNENFYETSNSKVHFFCVDENKLKNSCLVRTVNLNFTIEYFQCKSNKSQYSLKCIKSYDNQCEDNSNLQNCEQFVCPEPFIKCFNSYCIFPEMKRNFYHDCPHGEDELLEPKKASPLFKCYAYFVINIRDICVHLNSFKGLEPIIGKNTQFLCDNVCPKNYKCVSGKIEENESNTTTSKIKHLQFNKRSYVELNDVVRASRDDESIINSYLFSIVLFRGRKCRLTNFDYELQNWRLNNLIGLDISLNKINHSDYLKSVEQFSQLKLLNLSHNDNLIINQFFKFPISLEIIDISYTSISSLRNKVFAELKNLNHLNLSYTLITKFADMGLPEYFTLDTFYIQRIRIQRMESNFFRGLTINSGLMASDYVICCSQILNANISIDKCHAPVDFISSCKHLVGDTFKRVVIWIVGFLTLVSNSIALGYRIGLNREIFKKAYGHFIAGLAISDLFMGVYLLIIGIVDVYYKDVYVIDDFQWRNGIMCNVCGFLSTLSSETSTFFVCLITIDRFLCIAYPLGEHTFSKTGKLLSLTLAWFYGVVLALIPVVLSDLEIYSSNGLCLALPFGPIQNKGRIFSFIVFVGLNFVLFLFIALGQLSIFIKLRKARKSISIATQYNQRHSKDLSVAKKLAMVAFTNFCFWFPVGILGFLSLNGYIFNREVYAWFAVFVLPVNSALNPIIYTIPTVYSKCKVFIHNKLVALRT